MEDAAEDEDALSEASEASEAEAAASEEEALTMFSRWERYLVSPTDPPGRKSTKAEDGSWVGGVGCTRVWPPPESN